MKTELVRAVISGLDESFTPKQIEKVKDVILSALSGYELSKRGEIALPETSGNNHMMKLFIVSKKIEGCTDQTLRYYASEIKKLNTSVGKRWEDITTDDIRLYIADQAIKRGISKTTQDNELRIFRSFFGWLVAEEHVRKDPTRRIAKIKQEKRIKKPFTEIEIERLRAGARDPREKAIVDLLLSTGMRVGELVALNRGDVAGDECTVYGKGEKERRVYINAKSAVSLSAYLQTRDDAQEALFVSFLRPHKRLSKCGVEDLLRGLGESTGIEHVHPHRFRRTAATLALNRGMPIDQVRQMLGHENMETTLIYAQAAQSNVKESCKKYLT